MADIETLFFYIRKDLCIEIWLNNYKHNLWVSCMNLARLLFVITGSWATLCKPHQFSCLSLRMLVNAWARRTNSRSEQQGLHISSIACGMSCMLLSIQCGGRLWYNLKNAGPPMQILGYFHEFTEFIVKVYLSMEAESAIAVSNSSDLPWFGLKSKHF